MSYKYPATYKVKLDSLLSYQRELNNIVKFCGNNNIYPDTAITAISELHRVEFLGDKYFKNAEEFRIDEYYRNPSTTFAGLPAIKMIGAYYYNPNIFEIARGEESAVNRVLWNTALFESKDAFFGVAYFADDQPSFNQFLPVVQKMIDSVKLTSMKPQIIEEG